MAKKWQSLDECQANGRVLTKDKWHCFGELHANGKMQKANLSAVKAACLMGSGLRSGVSQLEERRLRSSGSGAPGGALIFIQTSNDDILQKFMLNKIKNLFFMLVKEISSSLQSAVGGVCDGSMPRPSFGQVPRPSSAQLPRPSSDQLPRPSSGQLPRPSSGQVPRPPSDGAPPGAGHSPSAGQSARS